MSESLADVDIEGADPFRAAAVLSSLVIFASYLLPWATVDGIGKPLGDSRVVTPNTTVQGPISPQEVSAFPELIVGVAACALVVVLLRWTIFWQFAIGVLGLGAGYATLYLWAYVDASGRSEFLELGPYVALPSAFEPAIGLWLAVFGSLGLILAGFAAATRTYVQVKRLEG